MGDSVFIEGKVDFDYALARFEPVRGRKELNVKLVEKKGITFRQSIYR